MLGTAGFQRAQPEVWYQNIRFRFPNINKHFLKYVTAHNSCPSSCTRYCSLCLQALVHLESRQVELACKSSTKWVRYVLPSPLNTSNHLTRPSLYGLVRRVLRVFPDCNAKKSRGKVGLGRVASESQGQHSVVPRLFVSPFLSLSPRNLSILSLWLALSIATTRPASQLHSLVSSICSWLQYS